MADKKPSKTKQSTNTVSAKNSKAQPPEPPTPPVESQEGPSDKVSASFGLQRIFIINSDFNLLDAPQVFKRAWNPNITVGLDVKAEHLEGNLYLAKTRVEIKGELEEKESFNLELRMGGIFEIAGLDGDLLDRTLHIVCPSILFPYMREHIDSLMTKASFPPLMLAPIDFETLYRQNEDQRKKNATLAGPSDYRPKMPS